MNFDALSAVLTSNRFNPLDRHFSERLVRLSERDCPELALAAALVSRALADGHSCVRLADFAGRSYPNGPVMEGESVECPSDRDWEQALRKCDVVGQPGADTPLILDAAGHLYLQRYWRYEQAIAHDLLARSQAPAVVSDRASLKKGLARLFPGSSVQTDWQKVGAFTAVTRTFSIITGGPGTGKTWTVARVLALLLEQPGAEKLKFRLAAPTGKAAARLQESLAQAISSLDCPEPVRQRLQAPDLSTTLHRLLGPIPNTARFRHDRDHPLPVDVLIIDEASMVSLSLMAHSLAALRREGTRLVLVGDKDQLPPVDPGGVLADLCRAASLNRFSAAFCEAYQSCTGEVLEQGKGAQAALRDVAVQLQVNHRSGEAAVLNSLSVHVNAGAAAQVVEMLATAGPSGSPVAWQPLPGRHDLKKTIRQGVLAHYRGVLEALDPGEALEALNHFRILCAVREGPFGMLNLNRVVEEILAEEWPALRARIRLGVYPGKPVMVTANNYTLKVFNGDTGVLGTNAGATLVHFPDETGVIRAIARERLPEYETAYAMTVHKSQGSEFDHLLLVLPDKDNPVLTRELIYTAVSRAKKSVRVLSGLDLLSTAINRQAHRLSGLTNAFC
jgi:exodeoxyribonuclease V alpha subunit